jgi:PAS domain S-box-containing protein
MKGDGRLSEAHKTAILESALDGIICIDHEGRIIEFNPAAERTFGYRREDVLGRELAEVLIPPSMREEHRRGLERYLSTSEGPILDRRIEMPAVRGDGTHISVEFAVTRINTDGLPIFTAHLRDITARKRVQEALRESEVRHRQLIGLVPVALYTCEAPSGRITFFNQHAVAIWGRTPEYDDTQEKFCGSYKLWDLEGNPISHEQSPMALALREGLAFHNQEVVVQRPDGVLITVLANIEPVLGADGRVVGAINAFNDISARKPAEEAQARLAAIVEASEDAIVSKSLDGVIRSWNASISIR